MPESTPPHAPSPTAPQRARDEGLDPIRLQSTIALLLMIGLILALPYVLSTGAVVFIPPVTAVILSIVLTPLAHRLTRIGLPSALGSLLALLVMAGVVALALTLILLPAYDMVNSAPALARSIASRFAELRAHFAWLADVDRQINRLSGPFADNPHRVVTLATPSVIEQLAFATPSVALELLLTILMTFFMVEARVRLRLRLMREAATGSTGLTTSLRIAGVVRDVQDRVASYLLTVAQINFGVGVIVAGGASAFGLTAPVMWGGLAFVLNFLPYLGPLIMVGLLALVGLGTASTVVLGLVPALSFLALHAIEANLVTPSILGARFTLNPVTILVSFSLFTLVWGFLGALLSVPILLTLSALFDNLGRPNPIGFLYGEPLFLPGRWRALAATQTFAAAPSSTQDMSGTATAAPDEASGDQAAG